MVAESVPWEQKSISENVYHHLKTGILQGDMPPGQRLLVLDIASQFGVSQAPVREALERLKQEGLITGKPNKGSFVSEITPKEIYDVFAIREILEVFAVRETLPKLTEADYEHLTNIVAEMQDATRKHDFLRIVEVDLIFHGYFYQRCGNQFALDTWDHMKNKIMRYMALNNRRIDVEILPEAHHALIEVLRQGNEQEIEKRFVNHMRLKKNPDL